MSTTDTQKQRVKLLKPHEHAHRQYPAGSVLTLSAKKAEWLVALRVAEDVATDAADVTLQPGSSV